MKVYQFETFYEFGYCRDPHRVFMIVRKDLKGKPNYTVTDGFNDVPVSEFKMYPTWEKALEEKGEVYYEVYTKAEGMLGIIKITKHETID